MGQQFGDTTLTKVFVGGLAWETQKETLREHFEKYGEILEAVIISDKITGRSKGYGFVTFKEPESAKKACEDPSPMINGRRANCNLASLGAKRNGGGGVRSSPPSTPAPLPPHHHHPTPGMAVASRGLSSGPPAPWYYHPSSGTPPPPSPFHHHQYQGLLPYYAATYGYTPNYMTDLGYNTHKLGHAGGGGGGGGFYQGQFSYPGQAGMVAPNGVLPMYPVYQFHHHHQSQGMGLPAHFYPQATAATGGAMATIPTIITKPTAMAPPTTTVCMAVEQVTGCS